MKTTMKDVADKACVDKATVSRVLKGDCRISEKTKIKVWDAVKILGYRPNLNARNLRASKSGFLGVVFQNLNEPWTSCFIAGIDRLLSSSHYDMLVKCTDGNAHRAAREMARLRDRGTEGIIWADSSNMPDFADFSTFPIIALGFKIDGFVSVTFSSDSPEKTNPTFETGVLAGNLMLRMLKGKYPPCREIIIKQCKD